MRLSSINGKYCYLLKIKRKDKMNKIHVDSSIGVHVSNGIAHIVLASDDLNCKFQNEVENKKSTNLKATHIVSMPLVGVVETLNILQKFVEEPHIKMILDSYVQVGLLEEKNNEK